jgi:hypothetical protein
VTNVSIREQIINADDIDHEIIDIPVWGVKIEVRSMTGRARTRLIKTATDNDGQLDMETLYPDMVILCAFDPETGEQIFTQDDRDLLLSKSAGPLEQVALAAMRISGMTPDALDAAGKDLPSTEDDDSSLS